MLNRLERSAILTRGRRSNEFLGLARSLLFIAGVTVGYVLILTREETSSDGRLIQAIARGQRSAVSDPSYQTVGTIYQWLGLAESPKVAGLLGFTIYSLLLGWVLFRQPEACVSWRSLFVFSLSVFLGANYLGTFSKDSFVIPIIFLVLIRIKDWKWDLVILGAIIFYASNFRAYWFLIASLYVIFRILFRYVKQIKHIFIIAIFSSISVSTTIFAIMGSAPDYNRTNANQYRITNENVNTIILPFVDWPQPLGGIFNNLMTSIMLLIPIPLFFIGGIFFLFLATVVFSMWICLYLALPNALDKRNYSSKALSTTALRCISLLFSFIVVQGLFEPDYGSAIRHLTPLLPCMLLIIFMGNKPHAQIY